jgi:hypothetical protein
MVIENSAPNPGAVDMYLKYTQRSFLIAPWVYARTGDRRVLMKKEEFFKRRDGTAEKRGRGA